MAWFTAASSGATCVAAYDAVGASSLADSYVNEANPGTNDAAPGVAPTWAYGTGWTFDGATQYLTTGVVPGDAYSCLVRYSGLTYADDKTLWGSYHSVGGSALFLVQARASTSIRSFHGDLATFDDPFRNAAVGVIGVAAKNYYFDGASVGTIGAGAAGTTYIAPFLGALNVDGSATQFCSVQIAAWSIYSGTIDATDVATITAAMNALPVASGGLLLHRRMAMAG